MSDSIDDPDPISETGPVTSKRKTTATRKIASSTAKGKGKGKATTSLSKNFVSSVEWPEHLKKLQKTFQALNTVYTFLSARKHLASTFDNLRSSVEAVIKRCVYPLLRPARWLSSPPIPAARSRFTTLPRLSHSCRPLSASHISTARCSKCTLQEEKTRDQRNSKKGIRCTS